MVDSHIAERSYDGIATLTKVNIETRQGVSMSVLAGLGAAMDRVRDDPSIRCVIIDAAGDGFHNGAVMLKAVEAIAVPEPMATRTWLGPTAAFFENKAWDYTSNGAIPA